MPSDQLQEIIEHVSTVQFNIENLKNGYITFDREIEDSVLDLNLQIKEQEERRKTLEEACITTLKYYDSTFSEMQEIIMRSARYLKIQMFS
jgi:DNA repair exonuclease SbcCD ATPase subunit